MADTNAPKAWEAPVLEDLGELTDVANNPGSGGDLGTPGDSLS